jgi:hypothetical protein
MKFLQRLLPGDDHASLLGDIQEEAKRRSRLWYWWQLAAVVLVCANRDARKHPLLVVRAIAAGSASLFAYFWGLALFVNSNVIPFHSVFEFYLFAIVAMCGGFVVSGWVVGRLNSAHGIALVMSFAASLLALWLMLVLATVLHLSSTRLSALDSAGDIIKVLGMLASVLLGGYWSTRRVKKA